VSDRLPCAVVTGAAGPGPIVRIVRFESDDVESPVMPGAFPGFAPFRDEEDAPFFRSSVRPFDSPEATAGEIVRRFSAL
jgi:hypothetical protein